MLRSDANIFAYFIIHLFRKKKEKKVEYNQKKGGFFCFKKKKTKVYIKA